MTLRPRIGLLFLTSGWFRDVGLQNDSAPLSGQIDIIAGEIKDKLSCFLEPVYDGVVYSELKAGAAAEHFRTADIDGLIIAPLMWCEDQILRAALKRLPKLPVIVCTVFPYKSLPDYIPFSEMLKGSGSVGTLQMSGMLRREGWDYHSVAGYYCEDQFYDDISIYTNAFAMTRVLKNTKCGVLPFRCEQMSTTYVDEFALRTRYGIDLQYLELQRFRIAARAVTDDEIGAYKDSFLKDDVRIKIDNRNLSEGIRYALAMEQIMQEEDIGILAMNDVIEEMHDCFGLRPSLDNPRLNGTGAVVSMEADIAAGIAMYILKHYTGEIPFYTEIFTADITNNTFLMGHAGYHDSKNRDKSYPFNIVPDVEYKNTDVFSGACTYFKFKSGPITVVNCVYNGEKLKFTAFEAFSLSGPPKMEGNCHLVCQPDFPVSDLYRLVVPQGVSQHWIIIPGHYLAQIKLLATHLDILFDDIICL